MKHLLAAILLLTQARGGTGMITGRVVGPDGIPVANMRVAAAGVDDGALSNIVQTGSDGRFRLENVSPGRYYILSGRVDSPTYYPGVTSTATATVLTVTAGSTLGDMEFVLSRAAVGFNVRGRVEREGPLARESNFLVALAAGQSNMQIVQAAADGTFAFSNVVPATYSLSLRSGGPHIPQRITVSDRDVNSIQLLPRQAIVVLGTMRTEGNGPRPQLTMMFENGSQTFEGRFSTNGTVTLEMPPGEYRLRPPAAPAGYTIKAIRSTTNNLMTDPLVLRAGDSPLLFVELGVLPSLPRMRVSGRLLGTVPDGAKIALRSAALADIVESVPNADGTFEFRNMLPGSYVARVTPSPGGVQEFRFDVQDMDLTDVEYTLPELRRIRGHVDAGGGPIPARIGLVLLDARTGGRSGGLPIIPNASGDFTVTFAPGEYRVELLPINQTVKSFTHGSTNILSEPWIIPRTGALEELTLTFVGNR